MRPTELAASVTATDGPWTPIALSAPKMAPTMRAYLDQIAVSLRPRSVEAADNALRSLATYLTEHHRLRGLKGLRRHHIESYKLWLARRPVGRDKTMSARTIRHRLGMQRVFLERIIDWGWTDAPKSCPILQADLPRVDDPLPRFLDDAQAAALMRTAAVTDHLIASSSRCSPAQGCGSASCARSKPTPSCA